MRDDGAPLSGREKAVMDRIEQDVRLCRRDGCGHLAEEHEHYGHSGDESCGSCRCPGYRPPRPRWAVLLGRLRCPGG
jgi:hypothetical protein